MDSTWLGMNNFNVAVVKLVRFGNFNWRCVLLGNPAFRGLKTYQTAKMTSDLVELTRTLSA